MIMVDGLINVVHVHDYGEHNGFCRGHAPKHANFEGRCAHARGGCGHYFGDHVHDFV